MLDGQAQVLLIHHRSQADAKGLQCPSEQPWYRQVYSYRKTVNYVRLFLEAIQYIMKSDRS
jgi:hypothetical protein